MRGNRGLEAAAVANTLDNPRDERGAVEHGHLARHADVGVDEGIVVGDHVFIRGLRGNGVFEGVGGPLEEQPPERAMDEM